MNFLGTLRRITSGGKYIGEIDGLRFVAISSVVAFHLFGYLAFYNHTTVGPLFTTILHNGDRGVPLFFVISGFILAVPFASHHVHGRQPVNLRGYFLRRLARLEPPYLLNLLVCFVVVL